MQRFGKTIGFLATITLIGVGCQDSPTSILEVAGAVSPTGPGREFASVAFDIEASVAGSIRLDQPLRITASIRSHISSDAVTFKIAAPELELASRNNWGSDFDLPVRTTIPPLLQLRSPVTPGSKKEMSTTIRPRKPGYYRVVISAISTTSSSDYQPTIHRELWLFINEHGGHVTRSFEPELVPKGYAPQPGPWRKPPKRVSREAASSLNLPGSVRFNMTSAGDGNDYYRMVYWDNDANHYEPVPSMTGTYKHYREDPYSGASTLIGEGSIATDGNGVFSVPCSELNSDGYDWYSASIGLVNARVSIANWSSAFGATGTGGEQCGLYTADAPYEHADGERRGGARSTV